MGVFGMARFLCCCLLGLLSFSVLTAEAARTIVVQPGDIVPAYVPGTGGDAFSDQRNWNATISDQTGNRHTVPVVKKSSYSWPSFRTGLKNALKLNPGQLALSGAIAGALAGVDYVISNSQVVKPGIKTVGGHPYNSTIYNGYGCSDGPVGVVVRSNNPNSYVYRFRGAIPSSPWTYINSCGAGPASGGHGVAIAGLAAFSVVTGSPIPVSDAELDGFVSGINDPQFAVDTVGDILASVPGSYDYPDSELFTGPSSIDLPGVTTTSTSSTGDTVVTESLPSIQLEYGTNPLSVTSTQTTVTNTYQNGTQTNTSISTETNTNIESPVFEQLTDCDFMPTVCSFIEWVKAPFNEQDPDLSELIVDDDYEKTVSFASSSSCPAPYPIETEQGSFSFDWQPACDFASLAKPFVIIAFLIAALYVTLGMGRTD